MSRGFARRIIPKILSPWYYFCEMSGKSFVVAARIVTMLKKIRQCVKIKPNTKVEAPVELEVMS